jgi:hypothetical protein
MTNVLYCFAECEVFGISKIGFVCFSPTPNRVQNLLYRSGIQPFGDYALPAMPLLLSAGTMMKTPARDRAMKATMLGRITG